MERQTGPCFLGVAASRLLQSLIYVQPQLKLIWVKVSWLRAHWGSPGPGPGPCVFKCHISPIQLCMAPTRRCQSGPTHSPLPWLAANLSLT